MADNFDFNNEENDELDEEKGLDPELYDVEDEERLELAKLEKLEEAEQRRKKEIEEKLLKNKLKQILRSVGTSSRISLKEKDKRIVKQAKAFPKLKGEISAINLMLVSNRAKNASRLMSASPVLFYVGIGALILFLIVAVVAVIGGIVSGAGGNANSMFGVTGADFYGVRMVYRDDEKATNNIIEDYVELVEVGIEKVNNTTIPNVNVSINLTIPSEDYSYAEFNEQSFENAYSKLYSIIKEIANIVNTVDNGTLTGTTLVEVVENIKYFGIVQTDANTNGLDDITETIQNAILTNTTFSSKDANYTLTSTDTENAENLIKTELQTLYAQAKYSLRAEKLFVKDYILSADDECVSNVVAEKYVSLIFMPKKNVTFSKLSFTVSNADVSNLSIKLNGTALTTDGQNLGLEEGQQTYIYSSGSLNLTADTFADVDASNLNLLANGLSLFDIIETDGVDYTLYLEEKTTSGENSVSFLTVKKNGVFVETQNDEAFNLVEYETVWE